MTVVLHSQTVAAGEHWDALRIPATHGLPLLRWLASDPEDRQHLGPVAYSRRSAMTYWLIPTGTTPEAWPTDCRLLTRGSWIALPGAGLDPASATWLHQPDNPAQLTGAVWLAAALDTFRRHP
jgi:hypothetical protein